MILLYYSEVPDTIVPMARWTRKRREQAAALYRSGLSLKEIARQLGSNTGRVADAIRNLVRVVSGSGRWVRYRKHYETGLANRARQIPWAWTPERHAQVSRMHVAGMLQEEIAAALCTSSGRVSKSLKLQGIIVTRHGRRNPAWKGGRVFDKHGYVLVKADAHPQANKNGYMREHRLVMERILVRPLLPSEVVHHKNGNRADNRPENLELYRSNGEHLRDELTGKCPQWSEDGKARIAAAARRPRTRKTHCPQGHEYVSGNIYFRRDGSRLCRTCVLDREKRKRKRSRNT